MKEFPPLEYREMFCLLCNQDITIDNCQCTKLADVAAFINVVLCAVQVGDMRVASLAWAPFTAYNDVERRAVLAAYHMDRVREESRYLEHALACYHASIILERHSEPERLAEVRAAHAELCARLAEWREDYPWEDVE